MPDPVVPPVVVPPVVPPVVTPPVATPQPGDENTPWFKERLARAEEQARNSLLADLGVEDREKAKAAIAKAKAAEDEQKTSAQKLGETSKSLDALKTEKEGLETVVKDHAARQMATLTDAQQAAVKAIAADNAAAQLRAIDALKPTWTTTPVVPVVTPPVAPPVAPPVVPPGGTAPAPTAPPQNGSISPVDHKAEYAKLKASNPHAASLYLNRHHSHIYPAS